MTAFSLKTVLISAIILQFSCANKSEIDLLSYEEWQGVTAVSKDVTIVISDNHNGVLDFMGNGGLILEKLSDSVEFNKSTHFKESGLWVSDWLEVNGEIITSIKSDVIIYGNPIDMRNGWTKFSGNPLVSGENTLLPLNKDNITIETIVLPEPGGVPQDQSILLGKGQWAGKWLLFFNHTPDKWPNEYYWSFLVAESLYPIKQGVNPFYIESAGYPLYGPINGQAPNDWLEVNDIIFAPDETYSGESHMWMSQDYLNWQDLGPISGILGGDPGLAYDGRDYYLFNENGNYLTYNKLDSSMRKVVEGDTVLHVGDHTGDPDLSFFNNQWHMFFDDGEHLHYNIGYAITSAEEFPYGWQLQNDIYGPFNPDQGQQWDDDNSSGNEFGTGDADIALEENTLYLFTERPIGVAFKEINEIFNNTGQRILLKLDYDLDGDLVIDKTSDWFDLEAGKGDLLLDEKISAEHIKITISLSTSVSKVSPLIRSLTIN